MEAQAAKSQDAKSHDAKPQADAKASKAKEIEAGKGMAVLAYIIALIPYFGGDKSNKFVRYHAIQGMNLLIIAVGISIVTSIINSIVWNAFTGNCVGSIFSGSLSGCNWGLAGTITTILWIPSWIVGIVDIIGLVNAANGVEKEVPLLGKFKIIKS